MRFRLVAPFLLIAQIGAAQTEHTTEDSAGRDTTARRVGDAYGLLAVYAIMALAPPSLLLVPEVVAQQRADTDGVLPENYLLGYETVGYAGNQDADGWGYATDIQGVAHHVYAEVRIQDWHAATHLQVRTLRTGYLWHPAPRVMGGITLGFRRAPSQHAPAPFEIGFPFIAASRRGSMRIEPVYAISAQGVDWTYRWETLFYLSKTRLVAGLDVDAKPLQHGGPYYVTMQLLAGLRR